MQWHFATEVTLEVWMDKEGFEGEREERCTTILDWRRVLASPEILDWNISRSVVFNKEVTFSCIGRSKYLVAAGRKNQWIVLDFPPSPPGFFMLVFRQINEVWKKRRVCGKRRSTNGLRRSCSSWGSQRWKEISDRRLLVSRVIAEDPFSRYVEKTRRILDTNPRFGIQNAVEPDLILQPRRAMLWILKTVSFLEPTINVMGRENSPPSPRYECMYYYIRLA